jgi:hypothetical protein
MIGRSNLNGGNEYHSWNEEEDLNLLKAIFMQDVEDPNMIDFEDIEIEGAEDIKPIEMKMRWLILVKGLGGMMPG